MTKTKDEGCLYLYKHNNTFAQDVTDGSFVVIITLENLFFQELSGCQMKGFIRPVEPTAIEPLLTCDFDLYAEFVINNKINSDKKTKWKNQEQVRVESKRMAKSILSHLNSDQSVIKTRIKTHQCRLARDVRCR